MFYEHPKCATCGADAHRETCVICNGSGVHYDDDSEDCPNCKGQGTVLTCPVDPNNHEIAPTD